MNTRSNLRAIVLTTTLAACAVAAAAAMAQPGPTPSTTPTAGTGGADAGQQAAKRRPVRRRGRLAARITRHVGYGSALRVRGRLRPTLRGRRIRLQVRGRSGWPTVARTRTGRGGRFRVRWKAPRPGRYRMRVRFAGDRRATPAGDRLARAHVYRSGHASWYGPGFYGNHTACGGRLATWTLGVAHRSLPCGTRVTFRYRKRSVTVPVIDRGPFIAGREWDLTAATKSRLGFGDVGVVQSTR